MNRSGIAILFYGSGIYLSVGAVVVLFSDVVLELAGLGALAPSALLAPIALAMLALGFSAIRAGSIVDGSAESYGIVVVATLLTLNASLGLIILGLDWFSLLFLASQAYTLLASVRLVRASPVAGVDSE